MLDNPGLEPFDGLRQFSISYYEQFPVIRSEIDPGSSTHILGDITLKRYPLSLT